MKEMIYKNKLEKEILDEGTVDGYRYKFKEKLKEYLKEIGKTIKQ